MKIIQTAIVVLALGLALGACAGASQSAGGTNTAQSGAATAVAAKLGISDKYVTMAMDAATAAFGASPKSADDKATAAQAGVDKAATQAQTDGTPLTDDQKTGLVDAVKGIL
jgi:hypothetical protein